MKFAKAVIFNFLAFLMSAVLTIGALLLCLKLVDVYLQYKRHAAYPDVDADEPTMRTLEYYPFTGGQIQAYKRERGKLAWSDFYDDFDMVSGEYGFFYRLSPRIAAAEARQRDTNCVDRRQHRARLGRSHQC
jgi:hypothetical protein